MAHASAEKIEESESSLFLMANLRSRGKTAAPTGESSFYELSVYMEISFLIRGIEKSRETFKG